MVPATPPESIYSRLGSDPDFGDLVELFVSRIPLRMATLEQAFSEGDMELLQRTAHQLRGSAGSYGFEWLGPAARTLEDRVRRSEPEESILQSLQELLAVCQRLRAGGPS